jgi:predicted membrane protein
MHIIKLKIDKFYNNYFFLSKEKMNKDSSFSMAAKAMSSVMGGWFIIVFTFVCAFALFMTVANCVVYGRIISNDDDQSVSKGFATALLIFNVLLAMFSLFGFFYILLKWAKYREMKKQIFTTEQVVKGTFDKGVNPVIEQRKNLYSDILQQPKVNYTLDELQNVANMLESKIPTIVY